MNSLKIRGQWKVMKGKIKQTLAKLTDDDLQYIEGKEDELTGRIQKRSGKSRYPMQKSDNESRSCCG